MIDYKTFNAVKKIAKGKTPSEIVRYPWDKIAFGFSVDDVITLPVKELKVKYKEDMKNTKSDMKTYFKDVPLSKLPPIEVSYDKGNFYIEDGHHRYVYAKQQGIKEVKVKIEDIKDNPILALGFDSIDDIIKLS